MKPRYWLITLFLIWMITLGLVIAIHWEDIDSFLIGYLNGACALWLMVWEEKSRE